MDPRANVPPDPPKTASATKVISKLKTISSKGKNQTSLLNFISRTTAPSREPGGSSKPVSPPTAGDCTNPKLTQNFKHK